MSKQDSQNGYYRPPVPPPNYQQSQQSGNVYQQPGPQQPEFNYNNNQPANGNQQSFGQFNGSNANDEKYDFNAPPPPSAGQDNFDEAFKVVKPKYNDIPFTILFLASVAGFIVVAVLGISYYHSHSGYEGSGVHDSFNTSTMNSNTVILLSIVVSVALLLSFLILVIASKWTKLFLQLGLICNVAFGLGTAIYYLVVGYYSAGIVFLVFAAFFGFCYWSLRKRIPFSATILRIVIGVSKKYPSCYIIALIGMIVVGAFSYLFVIAIVGVYAKWGDQSKQGYSQSKLIGLLVFVFYSGYYITEVMRTTIHVTLSGIYGTWYYLSKSDAGMPKHAALGSFKRAMTFCFGSICFGSLLVSLVQLLRQLITIGKMEALGNGNGWAYCLLVILDALAYVLDFCVRYFNHYAYSYIALYGKSYLKSARDTYHIFKYKGFDALINDCIIDTALGIYSFFAGFLSAFAAYMYLRKTKPAYNDDGSYYAPLVAFSFVIGLQVCSVITTVITSGTATFFLCLAKDPQVFQVSYPDDFAEIFRNYPQVMQRIQTPDN
ncbi:DEKNAAC102203 [Brettanomyces naardenensis]|uniref:Protein PNS1 n=1 Tax=Brettanomyces naardenensis TaxID=13370 RepID=A0A448YKT4_BRENA|nr:DEKNAAC102203 [Brettanomyces naardenensis]